MKLPIDDRPIADCLAMDDFAIGDLNCGIERSQSAISNRQSAIGIPEIESPQSTICNHPTIVNQSIDNRQCKYQLRLSTIAEGVPDLPVTVITVEVAPEATSGGTLGSSA